MDLYEYWGKKVRITTNEGLICEGITCDYMPPQDNVNGFASICIDIYEFYEPDIKSIEIIK